MPDYGPSFWTIGLGTVTICNLAAASGIFTGVYTIVKNKPNPGVLTFSAVLNSGATTSVFFGCREFVVTPLLIHFASGEQYARRRRELGISPLTKNETSSTLQGMSLTDLRWNKLLDSGLSGMLTGGALRGLRSVRAILPGAIVVGAASTILQYGYNELSIARLRYVSKLQRSASGKQEGKALNEVSEPAFQSLLKSLGIVPISDEEYLAKLRKSREIYLQRIAELEKLVEEEKLSKDPPTQVRS